VTAPMGNNRIRCMGETALNSCQVGRLHAFSSAFGVDNYESITTAARRIASASLAPSTGGPGSVAR
jgi:hypothetical protein